jgi:hypothetical protein
LVHPLLGAGPAAELLAVIGQDGETVPCTPELAQVVRGLLRRPERNEVAKPLVDREQGHSLPVTLGPERSVKPLGGKPGHQEVAVVHHGIADIRGSEIGRQLGLPNPLGEPEPVGIHPESQVDSLTHPLDLLDPVGPGKRGEHRLVESGQQQLDPPVSHLPPEQVQVGGVVRFEPLEQGSGKMQHDRGKAAVGKVLEQRTIDIAHVLLEDVVEIPDRLMQVNTEDESNGSHELSDDE